MSNKGVRKEQQLFWSVVFGLFALALKSVPQALTTAGIDKKISLGAVRQSLANDFSLNNCMYI